MNKLMQHSAESRPVPDLLIQEIANQDTQPIAPEFSIFLDALKQRFGQALDAVILYGSCLYSSDLTEGIADFYVLVDDYRHAYSERFLRHLNAWLPPNVFYLEVSGHTGILRAKYAVISTTDFEQGAQFWFHPYIWARFAQPSRVLDVRNETVCRRIHIAQAHAVIKFLESTLSLAEPGLTDIETIWASGLKLTYAAELRAEREARAHHLVELNLEMYRRLTAAALPALTPLLVARDDGQYHIQPVTSFQKLRVRIHWRLRRWQGRLLSILRLSKATLTFRDCLDYAAWKIERHTGIKVEITPMLRRYPILWGYKVMWQLLRRGVLR
jgi:hypothetical protein